MQVLSTHDVEVGTDKAALVELPNGRTLQLKLLERMPDGRHKVQVSINRPGKQDYLPLLTVIVLERAVLRRRPELSGRHAGDRRSRRRAQEVAGSAESSAPRGRTPAC